jgi:hypothetical protein
MYPICLILSLSFFFSFFLFWQDCGLNSGLVTFKAGALTLEPYLSSPDYSFFIFYSTSHCKHFESAVLKELKIYDGEIAASSTKTAGKTG